MQKFDDFLDKYLNEQDETFRSEYKKAKEELEDLLEKQFNFNPVRYLNCRSVPEPPIELTSERARNSTTNKSVQVVPAYHHARHVILWKVTQEAEEDGLLNRQAVTRARVRTPHLP